MSLDLPGTTTLHEAPPFQWRLVDLSGVRELNPAGGPFWGLDCWQWSGLAKTEDARTHEQADVNGDPCRFFMAYCATEEIARELCEGMHGAGLSLAEHPDAFEYKPGEVMPKGGVERHVIGEPYQ